MQIILDPHASYCKVSLFIAGAGSLSLTTSKHCARSHAMSSELSPCAVLFQVELIVLNVCERNKGETSCVCTRFVW